VKRRADSADAVPPGLLVFDGRGLAAAEWVAAYDEWFDRRDQFEADHPGVVLPEKQTLSSCPFDTDMMIGLPHAGAWSRVRVNGQDETRCGKHDLTPEEH
jgi:hypothetical protein